ncbi:Histidine phosphatase superfamily clade-2 [Penicillium canariense]|uniref:Phytase A n=1 Tax=Penicillium canariense TaxID=189055 RepID=A0A9W9IGF6_9EURO|nr:Histidine phosphatase superfamily clade-2 [Penicillium canariense]KAJ5175171.1 Histidine phosphatase superfamily clade-2 [Penicillium canariense]
MAGYRNRLRNDGEEEGLLGDHVDGQSSPKSKTISSYRWTLVSITVLLGAVIWITVYLVTGINGGYQCFADISHRWGQYSPYFSLADASISDAVPEKCDLIFVQVLHRHGARYPTASKSKQYKALVETIQANATAFRGKTAFLHSYNYTLGSDDLTPFGERQMISSGIKFYERYEALTRDHVPFIRSSGSSRVVASGQNFIQGFQQTKTQDRAADRNQISPTINVVISEDSGSNNTLNHNTCPDFEASELGDEVTANYTAIIAPPIVHRLQSSLPGVTLSNNDVTYLMDMCAFDTVSSTSDGSIVSAFCDLFTEAEWTQYNYLQSLSKYYGYGAGSALGPTQGVGFVNELIARMTHAPVHDATTTNHTLDAPGASTFPVNRTLYADFTHDNGMIPIFFALGLYNGTAPLPRDHVQAASRADGYSAAWTVPFGARAYIEMMQCGGQAEPLVRVLVNDRVVPLHGCAVDELGRCYRGDFVRGLSFAQSGGDWSSCNA